MIYNFMNVPSKKKLLYEPIINAKDMLYYTARKNVDNECVAIGFHL